MNQPKDANVRDWNVTELAVSAVDGRRGINRVWR